MKRTAVAAALLGMAAAFTFTSSAMAGDGFKTYPTCGAGAPIDTHCIIGNGWGAAFEVRGGGVEKYVLCVNPPSGPTSCRKNETDRDGYDFDRLYTEYETIGTYSLTWKKGGHRLDVDRVYLGQGDKLARRDLPGTDGGPADRGCDPVLNQTVYVGATNMACSNARRVAKRAIRGNDQFPKWNCTGVGATFGHCHGRGTRHGKTAHWAVNDKRKAADIYVYDTSEHYKQEPDRVVLDGMPGPFIFVKVRPWRDWGAFKTRSAMGKMKSNDCDPSCAEGELKAHKARLTLSHPRTCARRVYSKAVLDPRKGRFSPAGIDDPDLFREKLKLEVTCEGYVQPWG